MLIIGGENEKNIENTKKTISQKFEVTDMGALHYFLGVKVVQNTDTDRSTQLYKGTIKEIPNGRKQASRHTK